MEPLSVPMTRRCGKACAVDAVVFFLAVAPAIHVVVAHHIEQREKLGADRVRCGLGSDAVAAGGHQARGVFGVEDVQELAQGLGAPGVGLIADLVAGAPEHDAGMIAVAADEVRTGRAAYHSSK